MEEVQELQHEANWIAYEAYKNSLSSKRGAVEWPWRSPRTSRQKLVTLHLWRGGQGGYEQALGITLKEFEVVDLREGGELWHWNMCHCDGTGTVNVGDTLKAVNGVEGVAGLQELRRMTASTVQRHAEVRLEFQCNAWEAVPCLDRTINEYWFWHGAPMQAAQSIAAGHFQVSLAAQSGMYGGGIYFAESVTKSDEYTDRGLWRNRGDEEPLRCLLLCRVTLGSVLYNDDRSPSRQELAQQVINGTFDSVLGDREACVGTHREFIVFNADAIYPNYAIFYRRSCNENQ